MLWPWTPLHLVSRQGKRKRITCWGFCGATLTAGEAGDAVKLCALEEEEPRRDFGDPSNDRTWYSRPSVTSRLLISPDSSPVLAPFTLEPQSPQSVMRPREFYAFVHTVSLPGMLLPHWPSPPAFPLASAVNLLRVWSSLTLGPGRGLHPAHHVRLRVILSPHCNVNWREQQSLIPLCVHRAQQRPVMELASVNACWMNGGGRECLRRNSGLTRARQFQQQNYSCKHWVRKAFPFASGTFSPITGRNSWNLQWNLPTMRYVGDVCWGGTGDRSRTVTGVSPRDQREWKW